MNPLVRWTLWIVVAAVPTIHAGEAKCDDGSPAPGASAATWSQPPQPAEPPSGQPAASAEQQTGPPAATDERGEADGEARAGPSMVLGIAGIGVGVAGLIAGVGLLVAGADEKGEARDLTEKIQSEMPGSNPCGGPSPHGSCDDLSSAADDGVLMTTSGYLLFVGGGVLALASGLYLGVGGDRRAATEVSLQIAPELGPGMWGATAGGTF